MTPTHGIYGQLLAEDAILLFDVLSDKDPALAQQLASTTSLSEGMRKSVERVIAREFTHELGPSYEPNDRGRALDALLRRFLEKWPIPPQ
jgi:hypothetical protein